MKLCIPTETNEGKNAKVYGHFGSAPYFTIVDTEKDTVEVIDNANPPAARVTMNLSKVLDDSDSISINF